MEKCATHAKLAGNPMRRANGSDCSMRLRNWPINLESSLTRPWTFSRTWLAARRPSNRH